MRSSTETSPCRTASLRICSSFLISSSALVVAAVGAASGLRVCVHALVVCATRAIMRIVASFIPTPISITRFKDQPPFCPCHQRWLLRSLHCDAHHLISPATQQVRCSQKSSRWIVAVEVGPVDAVECVVEFQVSAEDLHGDHVVHGQSGRLNGLLDSLHHEPGLLLGARRGHVCLRVEPYMTRDIKSIAVHHDLAAWQVFPVS